MRHEDVDVNLVNQFNGILAVSVVLVINSFEKRIALPIQILLRNEGVPAKNRLRDLLVCIAVEFHYFQTNIASSLSKRGIEFKTHLKSGLEFPSDSLFTKQSYVIEHIWLYSRRSIALICDILHTFAIANPSLGKR